MDYKKIALRSLAPVVFISSLLACSSQEPQFSIEYVTVVEQYRGLEYTSYLLGFEILNSHSDTLWFHGFDIFDLGGRFDILADGEWRGNTAIRCGTGAAWHPLAPGGLAPFMSPSYDEAESVRVGLLVTDDPSVRAHADVLIWSSLPAPDRVDTINSRKFLDRYR